METIETKSFICASEREFLALIGDGTEVLKLSFSLLRDDWKKMDGWWLYERTEGTNVFIKQNPEFPSLISKIYCETKYLQFKEHLGITPNSSYYHYLPIGEIDFEEWNVQREKLNLKKMWKN